MHASRYGRPTPLRRRVGQPTSRVPVAALFRVPLASKSGAAVGISAAEVAILVYSRLQGSNARQWHVLQIWQLALRH